MNMIAKPAPDGTSLAKRNLSRRELWELHPGHHGLERASNETLAALELVRVRPTPRPTPAPGETVAEGPEAIGEDGHWHQTWIVTPAPTPTPEDMAARLEAQKAALEAELWAEVESRLRVEAGGRGPFTMLATAAQSTFRVRARALLQRGEEFAARIKAATTVEEAHEIRAELDQAPPVVVEPVT